MKRLYLIRHAKSSWKKVGLSDMDRPLNKRGKRDAPFMAKLLADRGVKPDIIVSSPASRAFTTAKIFSKELEYSKKQIVTDEGAYFGGTAALLEIIHRIPDSVKTTFLFGHNPDITALAEELSGREVENIPTCGVFCIDFETDAWNEASPKNGTFVSFDYPKKHLEESG